MDRRGYPPPEAFGRGESQRRFSRKITGALHCLCHAQGTRLETFLNSAVEGEGEMRMWAPVILAAVIFSTSAYAQAPSPNVGTKPLVQVKSKEQMGCKLVGTVRGTKLWAGDCTGPAELRGSATATETQSLPERANRVIPPGQRQ
jgi:hypothetical protein